MKAFFVGLACLIALPTFAQSRVMENPCLLIRKIPIQYKKPRPHEAKQTYPQRYCLLNICPERQGEMARRVLKVQWEGKTAWREFDVMREFQTETEALAYAEANKVSIDITQHITGTAQNAKQGAMLHTSEGLAYYLEGKDSWEDDEVGKTFVVEGFLREVHHDDKLLLDNEGNYKAGSAGKQNILEDWHIVK